MPRIQLAIFARAQVQRIPDVAFLAEIIAALRAEDRKLREFQRFIRVLSVATGARVNDLFGHWTLVPPDWGYRNCPLLLFRCF